MYRVVQEALQNAVKYSHASQVTVQVQGTPASLSLVVSDDGVGFDTNLAWGSGLGLISMRERVESIGGTIAIRSGRGAGTRLEITAPLDADWTEDAGNGNNAARHVRADSA
jgi:two-component system sensor histidine kinase DegS